MASYEDFRRNLRGLERDAATQARHLRTAMRRGDLKAGAELMDHERISTAQGLDVAGGIRSSATREAGFQSTFLNEINQARERGAERQRLDTAGGMDLNRRMDDFIATPRKGVSQFTPEARNIFHGLRREAALTPGFAREPGAIPQTGAGQAPVGPRKPGEEAKQDTSPTESTAKTAMPDPPAGNASSKNSGEMAKEQRQNAFVQKIENNQRLTSLEQLNERAKLREQQHKQTSRLGHGILTQQEADAQTGLNASKRGPELGAFDPQTPGMNLGVYDENGSYPETGPAKPSKFLDNPDMLGGREGFASQFYGLDWTPGPNGMSPAEEAMKAQGLGEAERALIRIRRDQAAKRDNTVAPTVVARPELARMQEIQDTWGKMQQDVAAIGPGTKATPSLDTQKEYEKLRIEEQALREAKARQSLVAQALKENPLPAKPSYSKLPWNWLDTALNVGTVGGWGGS